MQKSTHRQSHSAQNNRRYYDHVQYLATQPQSARWEPVPDESPLIHVQSALKPAQYASGAFDGSTGGSQADSSESIAHGTLIRAFPVIILFLPLSIAIAGLGVLWGFIGSISSFSIAVLFLWGMCSLWTYFHIARTDHVYSHYGVEIRKVDAAENVAISEIESRERLAMAALDAHKEVTLRRLGVGLHAD